MIVIRDPKTFCFNFDWPNNVDDNLKHEVVFIIKSNVSLADQCLKKDGYMIELQTPETMKIFNSTKKINRQSKKWRKCSKS